MTEKFGEGCIEERVSSSLTIRAGVVIAAVGMGREEGARNIINHAAA